MVTISEESFRARGEARVRFLDSRLPALDGVRGVAILLVLGHNLALFDTPSNRVMRAVEFYFDFGWSGVTLFFVLSGFLITRILLRSQESPTYFRTFYVRRALRIFPLYFGLLLACFVVLPAWGTVPEPIARDLPRQFWYWVFLSNWMAPDPAGGTALPHLWSLAVEEQFYLVWPWLVHRRTPSQVMRMCIVVAMVGVAARAALVWAGVSAEAVYTSSLCRMDALALGGAAAAVTRVPGWLARVRAIARPLLYLAAIVFLVGLAFTHNYSRTLPAGQVLGYSLLALVFMLFVLAAAGSAASRPSGIVRALQFGPLRAFGRYSFAMYLFHKPLHEIWGKPLLESFGLYSTHDLTISLMYVATGTLVTFSLGWASYNLLEKHLLNRRPFDNYRRADEQVRI